MNNARVDQLDFLRGFALLTITLNHYSWFVTRAGYAGPAIPNIRSLGFSDSAPIFFITLGFLIGIIYCAATRPPDLIKVSATLFNRAVQLLAMNCVLFVIVLAMFSLAPVQLEQIFNLHSLQSEPYHWAYEVLALGYNLPLLDILNVYILLLLVAIPFAWLVRSRPKQGMVLVAAAYVFAQFFPHFAPRGGDLGGQGAWFFNPLAWSVFLLGGMLAGRFQLHERIRALAVAEKGGRKFVGALVSMFLAFAFVRVLADLGEFDVPLTGKGTVQPLSLANALVTFVTLLALLFRYDRLRTWAPWRFTYATLVMVGKHSLHSFMASVALSYGMLLAWLQIGGTIGYVTIAAAGMAALIIFGAVLEVLKAARTGKLQMVRRDPVDISAAQEVSA